jgi:hypothetical protein
MKELLEKSFKNIKNGKKIINKEFSGIGLGKKFLWEPLERLLRFHPDKDIGNLEYFILRNHPRYKSQALFYKTVDQEEDTISYDLCLRCVFGRVDMEKEKKKFIQSELRSAIWNGTRLEFITNTSRTTCECCERGGKMVVDHYPVPFCDIVSGYCKYTNKKLDSIAEDDYTDFRNYHDSIASYRILCGECNSRFGNYKGI